MGVEFLYRNPIILVGFFMLAMPAYADIDSKKELRDLMPKYCKILNKTGSRLHSQSQLVSSFSEIKKSRILDQFQKNESFYDAVALYVDSDKSEKTSDQPGAQAPEWVKGMIGISMSVNDGADPNQLVCVGEQVTTWFFDPYIYKTVAAKYAVDLLDRAQHSGQNSGMNLDSLTCPDFKKKKSKSNVNVVECALSLHSQNLAATAFSRFDINNVNLKKKHDFALYTFQTQTRYLNPLLAAKVIINPLDFGNNVHDAIEPIENITLARKLIKAGWSPKKIYRYAIENCNPTLITALIRENKLPNLNPDLQPVISKYNSSKTETDKAIIDEEAFKTAQINLDACLNRYDAVLSSNQESCIGIPEDSPCLNAIHYYQRTISFGDAFEARKANPFQDFKKFQEKFSIITKNTAFREYFNLDKPNQTALEEEMGCAITYAHLKTILEGKTKQ